VTDVKGGERTYSSPLRAKQAEVTRKAVLDAARDLFITQGYGATTIDQIAARAGVSKPTVFTAVGNKQTVLSAVRDVAMAGDDAKVAVAERPLAQRIRSEPDQRRALELIGQLLTEMGGRYAKIDAVLRGAAHSGEPELRELYLTGEEQRLIGARMWVSALAEKGPLRQGLDTDQAVDVMWLYMSPDLYHKLVHVRGWTPERYQRWAVEALATLLPPRDPVTS
jgi:AcrR family transcriptional regulator